MKPTSQIASLIHPIKISHVFAPHCFLLDDMKTPTNRRLCLAEKEIQYHEKNLYVYRDENNIRAQIGLWYYYFMFSR